MNRLLNRLLKLAVILPFAVSGTASAVTCATLTAGVAGLSDCLQVTFGMTTDARVLIDHPGESVTEDIGISIPQTNAFDTFNNKVAYLFEPGTETLVNGILQGEQSDIVTLHVSGGPNQTTELHFTLGSDEAGRGNLRDEILGVFEDGTLQNVTSFLFPGTTCSLGVCTVDSHPITVLVQSDAVEAIPEPGIYAMMGIGLVLMGFVARRRRPQGPA